MKLSNNLTKTFLGGIINSTKPVVRKLMSVQSKIESLEADKEHLLKEIEKAEETGKHFLNGKSILNVIKELENGKSLKELVEEINSTTVNEVPQNSGSNEEEFPVDTTEVPVEVMQDIVEREENNII